MQLNVLGASLEVIPYSGSWNYQSLITNYLTDITCEKWRRYDVILYYDAATGILVRAEQTQTEVYPPGCEYPDGAEEWWGDQTVDLVEVDIALGQQP
jgi:hypothetical protein